jgi:hypothetical protein
VCLRDCRCPRASNERAGTSGLVHQQHEPHFRRRLLGAIISITALGLTVMAVPADVVDVANGSSADTRTIPAHWQQLEDATVGFSLFHPPDWAVEERVVSTQFADGARCRSVRFVDFEPPADSGAAAPMQQTFVQVCAMPKAHVGSLDHYMRRVYGESFDRTFTPVDLNGSPAYQAKGTGNSRTIFAETDNDLIQIVAAIATSSERLAQRQIQVQQILGSLQL